MGMFIEKRNIRDPWVIELFHVLTVEVDTRTNLTHMIKWHRIKHIHIQRERDTHTHEHKQNIGNLNKIGEL